MMHHRPLTQCTVLIFNFHKFSKWQRETCKLPKAIYDNLQYFKTYLLFMCGCEICMDEISVNLTWKVVLSRTPRSVYIWWLPFTVLPIDPQIIPLSAPIPLSPSIIISLISQFASVINTLEMPLLRKGLCFIVVHVTEGQHLSLRL